MLLGDTYGLLVQINGEPDSVASDPDVYYLYADYEANLGVVAVIDDHPSHGDTGVAQDHEPIVAMIINDAGGTPGVTGYLGKTADSIGIGSGIDTIRTVYGEPDAIWLDDEDPHAIAFRYYDQGLLFYADTSDTVAFEIHLRKPGHKSPVLTGKRATATRSSHSRYHRFRSGQEVLTETK